MRDVFIRHDPAIKVIFVLYFGRQKHSRYAAAQFDAGNHSVESVTEYVKKQRALRLVCAISGKPI